MVKSSNIRKVLIANRGEIAIRVIRTCREMGIKTVAVYSECDRRAAHVRWADEAYFLGASPATESYLNQDRVLSIAKASGADAIHPGYGFLSEQADFSDQCENMGLTFIGPRGSSMEMLGNKIQSRKLAKKLGVPIIPGLNHALTNADEAKRYARGFGYPVLIKASAGGGGKGLQIAKDEKDIDSAFHLAQSEAQQSFKDPTVFLEKFLQQPHHIEIQIFGDHLGKIIALGERECSLQRRHQKIIEESPSPFIEESTRKSLIAAAIRLGKEVGYQNAGTMEFLVDQNQDFYFLEMNARLQVEHPITECLTGIDMVRSQIRLAAGESIAEVFDSKIERRGHAIECRIYAEDPENDFFPCPGTIRRLKNPEGPGIRMDSAIAAGTEIPIYYDPMIAKLIAWGKNRQEAIKRLQRALQEYEIEGVKTNLRFLRAIIKHDTFIRGNYDTGFVERQQGHLEYQINKEYKDIALIGAFIASESQKMAMNKKREQIIRGMNPWRLAGRRDNLRW